MKKVILFTCLIFISSLLLPQNIAKDDQKTQKKETKKKNDKKEEIDCKYVEDEFDKLNKIGGSIGFSFGSKENDINEYFNIEVNGAFGKGIYPYELTFNLDVGTTIHKPPLQDKTSDENIIKENISNLFVSYDFHPFFRNYHTKLNDLLFENYIFIRRQSNDYLGMENKYEAGGGLILNFIYSEILTESGRERKKILDTTYDNFLKKRINVSTYQRKNTCNKDTLKKLEKLIDNDTLSKIKKTYLANKKNYSKFRFAFLAGINYEVEKGFARNIYKDSVLLKKDIETEYKYRLALRPTIVWKPQKKYTLKVYPYFKLPLTKRHKDFYIERADDPEIADKVKRFDYIFEFISSLNIKIEENFSINISYTYIYERVPKFAKFIDEPSLMEHCLIGQNRFSQFKIKFTYEL